MKNLRSHRKSLRTRSVPEVFKHRRDMITLCLRKMALLCSDGLKRGQEKNDGEELEGSLNNMGERCWVPN